MTISKKHIKIHPKLSSYENNILYLLSVSFSLIIFAMCLNPVNVLNNFSLYSFAIASVKFDDTIVFIIAPFSGIFKKVYTVEKQMSPNGDFPTVEYPNPEDPKAFELAIQLFLYFLYVSVIYFFSYYVI